MSEAHTSTSVKAHNWSVDERNLWARIAAHAFEHHDMALSFAGRLARDHDWPLPFARAAIEEYRRFCFLAVSATTPVTPSEEIDEVWHLHLTYTRDYWDEWCANVLKTRLHHEPTKGGAIEDIKFVEQYALTLARYETVFGSPDPAFWPGTVERFGRPRFFMADRARVFTMQRPTRLLAIARTTMRGRRPPGIGTGCGAGS